jgi:putative endonuclease
MELLVSGDTTALSFILPNSSFLIHNRQTPYLYPMAKHNELGKQGELIARKFLEDKGHTFVACNYKQGRTEIDLISRHQNILIFTEVKTRSSDFFASPERAVNEKKEDLIIRAAQAYLYEQAYEGEIRFDVISIVITNQVDIQIRHFEDAFFPGLS